MIDKIGGKTVAPAAGSGSQNQTGAAQLSGDFSRMLGDALDRLNEQGQQVNDLTAKVAAGDLSSVQQLMVATQKAEVGLELTMQVRNKVIEAYQEIMRTQI